MRVVVQRDTPVIIQNHSVSVCWWWWWCWMDSFLCMLSFKIRLCPWLELAMALVMILRHNRWIFVSLFVSSEEVHHYWKRADRDIELLYDLLLYYCIFVSLFVFVFYICIKRRGPLLKEGGQRLRTALWAEKAFGNSWSGLRTIVFSVFVFVYNLYLFCSCVFLCIITWGSWTGLVLYL